MMNLVITPKIMEEFPKETLLCSDNKIHIRLKTYNEPQTIAGFINKLTFIITYMISGYITDYYSNMNPDQFINYFQTCCPEYIELNNRLKTQIPGFEGIYILKEYSKLNPDSKLGLIKPDFIPKYWGKTLLSIISEFKDSLSYNVDIMDILLNDNIMLQLADFDNSTVYNKYINKAKRKESCHQHSHNNVIDLWEGDSNGNN